ncbi:MAG: DUF4906 domain-containing protein [Bacteroidales bacterium]|nr:DUF4906 domain-containing protein [Bacteroidales bacterium]
MLFSCSKVEVPEPEVSVPEFECAGEPVEARLEIVVGRMSVDGPKNGRNMEKGLGPVEENEAERVVSDLWVFQFDAESGQLVARPQYVVVPDQQALGNLKVGLRDNLGRPSVVYVVANTGDAGWAATESDSYPGFGTLDELKRHALPVMEPLFGADGAVSIPMGGGCGEDEGVTVEAGRLITVPLKKLYAKVMIGVKIGIPNTGIYNIGVGNIPQYCRVGSLSDDLTDEGQAADYPDVVWVSRTFWDKTDDADWPYVIYVPEILCGRQESEGKDDPSGRAFSVNLILAHRDENGGITNYPFTVYPGGDMVSDYNIRRNVVYRVKVEINALKDDRVPSANCFAVEPGETLAFYPYYRIETGGGFNFSDYVDPESMLERSGGKKIASVEILWQTKDCIGDNSAGDLVKLLPNGEIHTGFEKIYVKTQNEGNAVIAARNAEGDIIWSWHIWVTEGDPANEVNALTYYTYAWDESGIRYDEPRISGPQIMRRNLGALEDEPEVAAAPERTYGMLYQWGRKDPFPPLTNYNKVNTIGSGGYFQHDYDEAHAGTHYGNDNSTPVGKTAYTDPTKLFHSISGADITEEHDGITYTIAHPTVFMCGTKEVAVSLSETDKNKLHYVNDLSNYVNKGAWSEDDHVNTLWGGLELTEDMPHLGLGIYYDGTSQEISLYDDYGPEKTIFDPCPFGWRVSSSDLWLGFSRTSASSPTPNPEVMADVNCDPDRSKNKGMYMYLGAEWRQGETTYFPTQGYRLPDGCGWRVGACGNVGNANTDANDRVNIVHIHNEAQYFNIFETRLVATTKSSANPVRCVRDEK